MYKRFRHNRGAFGSRGIWGDRSMKSAGLCNLLTAVEVGKAYDETLGGDGCWQEEVCHSRRSYYQKGRGSRVRRSLHVEEIVVPIPEIPFVVLHTYVDKPRQTKDEVVIHAMCAELWIGVGGVE
jgi:hypothetical protein